MEAFVPKSNSRLRPGHYWAVPLADGRFAAGRVLQVKVGECASSTCQFFGGLHDWIGAKPPVCADICGTGFIAYGVMHIKSITETGGRVLGECELDDVDGELPRMNSGFSARNGSTMILSGMVPIRPARRDELNELMKGPGLPFWGFDFIQTLAEERLATGKGKAGEGEAWWKM